MKLHVLGASPNARKTRLIIEYLELPVEIVFHEISELKEEEFLGLNPMGAVPVLEDGDFCLRESNAILLYLASQTENTLFPNELKSRAEMMQWLFWEQAHFIKGVGGLLFNNYIAPTYFGLETNKTAVEQATEHFHRFMPLLNTQVSKNKYLVGDDLTVADFCLAGFFMRMEEAKYPMDNYASVRDWLGRLAEIPAWQKVVC